MTESSTQLPEINRPLRVLGNRLLVKLLDPESKTAGGIVLPGNLQKEIRRAQVVAVGPGQWEHGIFVEPIDVKKGDVVIFSMCMSTRVSKVGHEELLAIPVTDVMCVEEK